MKLLQGDCLDIMPTLAAGSVDLVLADLPYGTTACKWDSVLPLECLWKQYWRLLKPNGAVLLFGTQPFTTVLGASQIQHLRYSWVWEKTKPTNFTQAKRMPLRGFEDLLVFYRALPTYNPQGLLKVDRKVKNTGTKNRVGLKEDGDVAFHGHIVNANGTDAYTQEFTNYPRGIILEAQNGSSKSLHPTQKPVALLEYLIRTYSNEGDVVLDNTMGSGSTGVAALRTGRSFVGIERDDNYFAVAMNRIAEECH